SCAHSLPTNAGKRGCVIPQLAGEVQPFDLMEGNSRVCVSERPAGTAQTGRRVQPRCRPYHRTRRRKVQARTSGAANATFQLAPNLVAVRPEKTTLPSNCRAS